MKAKIFTICLAVLASTCTIFASVQIGNLYFNLDDESLTAEVASGSYSGAIDIPTTVTHNGITYNVTSIGNSAFYYCTGLTSISIPDGITSIGHNAFKGCTGLTSITIPESVTTLKEGGTFQQCTGLKSVVWNARECYLERNSNGSHYPPFMNLSNITSFTFGENVEYITRDLCYGLSQITSIVIPNSVTRIGVVAFQSCSSVTSVVIPANVARIQEKAFYKCSNLKQVDIVCQTPPSLDADVFTGCNYLSNIYVPCGTADDYQTAWNTYASMIAYRPIPTMHLSVNNDSMGNVYNVSDNPSCDVEPIILAVPNDMFRFYRWSDGSIENPRTVNLTQDTTLTAEFAPLTEECTNLIRYLDADNMQIFSENVTLHLPAAPHIVGFTFLRWDVVAGTLVDGINLQAVYTSDEPTSAPVVTNLSNPAQKLIRNGNVYILTETKTYNVQGMEIK